MNERIKELADECETTYIDRWDRKFIEFDKEKFAGLIIKECLSKVMEVGEKNDELIEPIWVAYSIANSIKEHFGVE